MRRLAWITGLWLLAAHAASCAGGVGEDVDSTLATVEPVRGDVRVGTATAAVGLVRVGAGGVVAPASGALARLTLDGGGRLLLDQGTEVVVRGADAIELRRGRVWADAQPGDEVAITATAGVLRVSDASASVVAASGRLTAYVVRGEVSFTAGSARGSAHAGEELTLAAGAAPTTSGQTLWSDWTGGLARPGPVSDSGAQGVGVLEARVPDELGLARWPLVVRRLDVKVTVQDDLAITEVDQLFFNPASETVEGLYRIRVPSDAVLQRFAVDRGGRLVDGYVREKEQARAAYQAQVYRGSTDDPALLEWDAPGAYRARIYPINSGETRRIVIRYAEWLSRPAPGAPRLYRYPMGGGARAPYVQEFSLSADLTEGNVASVRAGMGATVENGAVLLRRSDFRPRADFWLELVDKRAPTRLHAFRAAHEPPERAPGSRAITNEADERDYFFLPIVLPERVAASETRGRGMDLVLVADVSAGTDRAQLELGRSVIESLAAHLGQDDRVAIVTSDLTIRAVGAEGRPTLGPASSQRLEQLLDGLARVRSGGATDLGAAVTAAAGLLDPSRRGAVVYIGDGAPTVGELDADRLLRTLDRLPSPLRFYAVAVGADANLELLEAMAHGGGLAMRIEERADAGDAALRLLAHAARPLAQRVTVDLGTGIDNVFPRRPVDVVVGEALPVVGRVRGEVPTKVTVRGVVNGRAFTEVLDVETKQTDAKADLRLRWAGERLRHLLLEGAGREAVAELGTRYGLITPFTSFYVPSARELGEQAALESRERLERFGRLALLPIAGPFAALAGCDSHGDARPGATRSATAPPPESETEEASDTPRSDDEGGRGKRASDPHMARESSRVAAQPSAVAAPAQRALEPASDPEAAADPSTAEHAERAAQAGVLGVLGAQQGGSWNSPTSPYGQDTALGNDAPDTLGGLMGDQIGENFGFGGLGLRGTGRGGGGGGEEGTIGLGNLGTIGHGGGGGDGSGYGRGAGGFSGRDAAVPRVRQGTAEVRGALSREIVRRVVQRHINEVRFCYEQELDQRPDLEGRLTTSFIIAPTGDVQSAVVSDTTVNNARVEGCVAGAVRRWSFPAPEGGGIVVVKYPFMLQTTGGERLDRTAHRNTEPPSVAVTVRVQVSASHRVERCSDAALQPLDDRRALWRERLGRASGVSGWVDVYRHAARDCELPGWRDRRALLDLMLGHAGNVETMVQMYRYLDDGSARGYLRGAILRRVRTPADLRIVREAFGLGAAVDWALVERLIAAAPNPDARIRVLRRLLDQFPDSFDLKLRLLSELEAMHRIPEAQRLADRMRADPLADAGVRTAIGEMYLRLGDEADARRVFSEIVEFAPYDELARRRLGDLYRAHGWFEDAYRQYETLATIRPDDPSVSLLLAQAAAGAGRIDEALRLEQKLAETAEPGASQGVARTAVLWSSVRFAKLREDARQRGDDGRVRALLSRMRRSGVLREAGAMRVSLTWSHPDAGLSLWASFPGLGLTRPTDISPENGLEAFDVREGQPGRYRIEVRRAGRDLRTSVAAELVIVWNEGQPDEKVQIVPLSFGPDRRAFAWTIDGRALAAATTSVPATEGAPRAAPATPPIR